MNFTIDAEMRRDVERAAQARSRSLSDLIVSAIDRCLADGIWGPSTVGMAIGRSIVPQAELIDLVNQLLRLSMAVELLGAEYDDPKGHELARQMIKDAKKSLERARGLNVRKDRQS